MTTREAIKHYENAEEIIRRIHPDISAVERAIKIEICLTDFYGEEKSDEIIDLVFDHYFCPVGLNKNE
jgi:hypothetical protein